MIFLNKILFLFTFTLPSISFAQKGCSLNTLAGEWGFNQSHWGVFTNVDSLKLLSQSHSSEESITIEFNKDSTYTLYSTNNKKKIKGYYFLDEKKCELILNKTMKRLKKMKFIDRGNWEIIYMDNEIFIYKEDNNPKNYRTHVLLKK